MVPQGHETNEKMRARRKKGKFERKHGGSWSPPPPPFMARHAHVCFSQPAAPRGQTVLVSPTGAQQLVKGLLRHVKFVSDPFQVAFVDGEPDLGPVRVPQRVRLAAIVFVALSQTHILLPVRHRPWHSLLLGCRAHHDGARGDGGIPHCHGRSGARPLRSPNHGRHHSHRLTLHWWRWQLRLQLLAVGGSCARLRVQLPMVLKLLLRLLPFVVHLRLLLLLLVLFPPPAAANRSAITPRGRQQKRQAVPRRAVPLLCGGWRPPSFAFTPAIVPTSVVMLPRLTARLGG